MALQRLHTNRTSRRLFSSSSFSSRASRMLHPQLVSVTSPSLPAGPFRTKRRDTVRSVSTPSQVRTERSLPWCVIVRCPARTLLLLRPRCSCEPRSRIGALVGPGSPSRPINSRTHRSRSGNERWMGRRLPRFPRIRRRELDGVRDPYVFRSSIRRAKILSDRRRSLWENDLGDPPRFASGTHRAAKLGHSSHCRGNLRRVIEARRIFPRGNTSFPPPRNGAQGVDPSQVAPSRASEGKHSGRIAPGHRAK